MRLDEHENGHGEAMDFDLHLSKAEKAVALAFIFLSVTALILLLGLGKPEQLPAALLSLLAVALSLLAYHFTRAKFRLDLFEKRWAVYDQLVQFLSLMQQSEPGSKETLEAAQGCIRGKGYHKSKALFGEEVGELFDRLNAAYSWLVTYHKSNGSLTHDEWARLYGDHQGLMDETVRKLPEYFRDYLYFGDFKR